MRAIKLVFLILTFLQAGLCETPTAMVTKVHGKVTVNGKPLELLSYLSASDQANVPQGAQLTLSYVKGGARATVTGPAMVQAGADKPSLVSGKPGQLQVAQPSKRVGVALPSDVNLNIGGSLRRGEVSLHLSRKILPGPQKIVFSALPAYSSFRLVVENSSTYEGVYKSEQPEAYAFTIPAGRLQPGQSYDFLLQATSDGGATKEVREEAVVVLSEDLARPLRQKAEEFALAPAQSAAGVELLALYLSYGLDRDALELLSKLEQDSENSKRLEELKQSLRTRLQYQP